MRVLYLYSEIGPYNIPVLRCLVEQYSARIDVVCWDQKCLKPYSPPVTPNVQFHRRSQLDSRGIVRLAETIRPDIIYVSGWMDKGYFPAARLFKSRGVPVVTGFDDQWVGSVRQRIGSIVFRLYYQRFFSHAWVAGPRQYEFAKRLGFRNHSVIHDMLSCDFDRFSVPIEDLEAKRRAYPRSFLYVGNFRRVKGTDTLAGAYEKYRSTVTSPWGLTCVGNGELKPLIAGCHGVEVLGYLPQKDIVKLCARAGVFILPSRHDQWGVVVHEFAAAGLPLLLSQNVGAKEVFFIEGYNGFSYPSDSVDALAAAMGRMAAKSDSELFQMGLNSRKLAARIDPATSAANFVSLVR